MSRLFESIRKKVNFVVTTGIFHLHVIILNISSGLFSKKNLLSEAKAIDSRYRERDLNYLYLVLFVYKLDNATLNWNLTHLGLSE
jgi:hypothetical protein